MEENFNKRKIAIKRKLIADKMFTKFVTFKGILKRL